MSAETLTRRVAKIIDETSFALTPQMYGLKTQQELLRQTLVGAAQSIATEKARKIIALIRTELQARAQAEAAKHPRKVAEHYR